MDLFGSKNKHHFKKEMKNQISRGRKKVLNIVNVDYNHAI
jgi:hypothetical protein